MLDSIFYINFAFWVYCCFPSFLFFVDEKDIYLILLLSIANLNQDIKLFVLVYNYSRKNISKTFVKNLYIKILRRFVSYSLKE